MKRAKPQPVYPLPNHLGRLVIMLVTLGGITTLIL